MAHRLSCSAACGIFPDQGSNMCPPALAGRFLTTAPPRKSEHPFLIKTIQKVGIEGTYLNIVKAIYEKSTANIIQW